MAREIKVEVGALNVRLHPHPAGTYEGFIKAIYRARKPIRLRGDREAVIRSMSAKPDEEGLIHGVLTTYLSIDVDQPWFNDKTFDEASEKDLNEIVLPNNLHPNVHSYLFALDPDSHKIYFETYNGKTFSHNQALKFFEGSAAIKSVAEQFGDAKISIVQSSLGLDKVFSIPRITEVKVHIERPNDIWPDSFERHLEEKRARSLTLDYKAERGQGIVRDDDIQELAEASLDNGYTEVSGYGAAGHVKLSTKSFPKIAQDKFDRDFYTAVSMFRRVISIFKRNRQ